MKNTYFPILIVIFGAILYQVAQKSVPKEINPFLVLSTAYVVGILICLICNYILPTNRSMISSVKELNWSVIGIGIGAISIEVGYLFAYRIGWNISITSLITSIIVAILLIPIGLIFYKENLSAWNALGIILCILGLVLISKK